MTQRLVHSPGDGGLIHTGPDSPTFPVGPQGFAKWQSASLCILVKRGGGSLISRDRVGPWLGELLAWLCKVLEVKVAEGGHPVVWGAVTLCSKFNSSPGPI